ncbi:MAG: LysE family translocator [Pseudoruegeria sp.]
MSFEAWVIFAVFWLFFVTTPGPNAVNCINNGMNHGLKRSMWGVLAILCQATLFLVLSALGVTTLIAASPSLFLFMKLMGAGFLIWVGLRGWISAGRPPRVRDVSTKGIFGKALLIAVINAKSVAGYLAAFTQFVEPGIPIWSQMMVIMPTALTLTALSYIGYTALGARLGKTAMGAMMNLWFRRFMSGCFILYGLLLGSSAIPLGAKP